MIALDGKKNISQNTVFYYLWSNKISLGEHKKLLRIYNILLTPNAHEW